MSDPPVPVEEEPPEESLSSLTKDWPGPWSILLCSEQRDDVAGGIQRALKVSAEHTLSGAVLMTLQHVLLLGHPDVSAGHTACAPCLHTGLTQTELAAALASLWSTVIAALAMTRTPVAVTRIAAVTCCRAAGRNQSKAQQHLFCNPLKRHVYLGRVFSSKPSNLSRSGMSPWNFVANTLKLGNSPIMLGVPR